MRLRTETKKIVIRRAIYAGLILLTAVMQNTTGLFPEIFGVRAMLLIPAVVCIGMHERDIPGLFYGLLAGVVWDAFSAGPHSFNAVLLMTFGFVCGALIGTIMRNNLDDRTAADGRFGFYLQHSVLVFCLYHQRPTMAL